MKIYNNFTELQKEEPEIAKTILDDVGPGKHFQKNHHLNNYQKFTQK